MAKGAGVVEEAYSYDYLMLAADDAGDVTVAQTLSACIEDYHPPRGTPGAGRALRGAEDYTGAKLDDAGRALLLGSRFLIVICSPAAYASAAIAEKLEAFAALGRKGNIIAVLVRGEPVEALPAFFIETKMVEHILPDGSTELRQETIEPVASDLRDDTTWGMRRRLDYETVRITAALLGLHPDMLEQRHQKRRRRRAAAIGLTAAAVMLVVGAVFLYMGLAAAREGRIAARQAEAGAAMAEMLFGELPARFAGDAAAAAIVQDTVLDGLDSLYSQQSRNLSALDIPALLAIAAEDDTMTVLRKAAMLRRFGYAAEAEAAYTRGFALAGMNDAQAAMMLESIEMLYRRPTAGYAMFVAQSGTDAVLPGDVIVAVDGQAVMAYGGLAALVADALPGTSFELAVLRPGTGAPLQLTVTLTREALATVLITEV